MLVTEETSQSETSPSNMRAVSNISSMLLTPLRSGASPARYTMFSAP